jgi:hypothetical protein
MALQALERIERALALVPVSVPDALKATKAVLPKVGRFCPVCRVAIARGACAAHPDVELVSFLGQLPQEPTEKK